MLRDFSWKCEATVVAGIWKFGPGVSIEDLKAFAVEWKLREQDSLHELYIRGVGKDGALGIGYRYQLPGINDLDSDQVRERVRAAFFRGMKISLWHRFGSGLVGWDFSSPTWTLVEK
jgi:hypothetical protein